MTIAHNVAVPTEPERDDGPPIRSQDICRGKGDAALPVLCEYTYAWKWKMDGRRWRGRAQGGAGAARQLCAVATDLRAGGAGTA